MHMNNVAATAAFQHPGYMLHESGSRIRQEDRTVTVRGDVRGAEYTLVGVFDGHGGTDYFSELASHQLPSIVRWYLDNDSFEDACSASCPLCPARLRRVLLAAFRDMQAQFCEGDQYADDLPVQHGGTTATLCVVTRNHVVAANVGDSPAMVVRLRPDGTHEIRGHTEDHDCENEGEIQRIGRLKQRGRTHNVCSWWIGDRTENPKNKLMTRPPRPGPFCIGRLSETLIMPTRNLGDCRSAPSSTAVPQIYTWKRATGREDRHDLDLLIVCSDGFAEGRLPGPRNRRIVPMHGPSHIADRIVGCVRSQLAGDAARLVFGPGGEAGALLARAAKDAVMQQVRGLRDVQTNLRFEGDNTSLVLAALRPRYVVRARSPQRKRSRSRSGSESGPRSPKQRRTGSSPVYDPDSPPYTLFR